MRLRKIKAKHESINVVTSNINQIESLLKEIVVHKEGIFSNIGANEKKHFEKNLELLINATNAIKSISEELEYAHDEKKMEYEK